MAVNPQSARDSHSDSVVSAAGQGQSFADEPASARFKILGVGVSPVQIPQVIGQMESWIQKREYCRYIAVTGMHGITEAQRDPQFRHILNSADLVVPDGMPLVWLGRRRGLALPRRVYGPELMAASCAHGVTRGFRHFLYGGGPGVADRLARALRERFPGIQIVGTLSPPFRSLTTEEDTADVSTINQSGTDVVWVSLSEIKQDTWMFEHRDRLNVPVLIGIGAAFDFFTGLKKQAPEWMRESGFEWLFRLLQEPRRLWRRYLAYGSRFVYLVALEELGIRKWE
ncbi:MAG TPA: WecB/TagA/CpsF family glycosyltransferase [Candidatus Acidoferrales bacterium]|nr:WecB/TagA/CpsF family glycosyltransferase [Candidatus Acidoferrales bacterium]